MSNSSFESQDFNAVISKSDELKEIFDSYKEEINKINQSITGNINVGFSSALSSKQLGIPFLSEWSDSFDAFNLLFASFEEMYASIQQTVSNNSEFSNNQYSNYADMDDINSGGASSEQENATVETYSDSRMSDAENAAVLGTDYSIGSATDKTSDLGVGAK
jgi:hypothetical protein